MKPLRHVHQRVCSFQLSCTSSVLHTNERNFVASRELIEILHAISQILKEVTGSRTDLPWNVVEQQNRDCSLGHGADNGPESNVSEAGIPVHTESARPSSRSDVAGDVCTLVIVYFAWSNARSVVGYCDLLSETAERLVWAGT